jgi:hypothetical protein
MKVTVKIKTDINHPRCQICPMLSPECVDHPCAMYGRPLAEKEKADHQLMYDTLERAEQENFKKLMETINGNRNL